MYYLVLIEIETSLFKNIYYLYSSNSKYINKLIIKKLEI